MLLVKPGLIQAMFRRPISCLGVERERDKRVRSLSRFPVDVRGTRSVDASDKGASP